MTSDNHICLVFGAGFIEGNFYISRVLQRLVHIVLILLSGDTCFDGSHYYLANFYSLVKSILNAFGYFFFSIFQHVSHSLHVGVKIHKAYTPVEHQNVSSLNNTIR